MVILRLFLHAAGLVLLVVSSGSAQEMKKTVLKGGAANRALCISQVEQNIKIYADKIVISSPSSSGGSGAKETIKIDGSGAFDKTFRSPNGGNYRASGNLKAQQFRLENLSDFCVWEGAF